MGEAEAVIRAAGGVVARRRGETPEVLVVHRPKYDDWSFPKGKALPGESDEACALREVAEETGLDCTLGLELPATEYRDSSGCLKRVRYWLMRCRDTELTLEQEVDDARWLRPADAETLLTYERDLPVLAAAEELVVARLDRGSRRTRS